MSDPTSFNRHTLRPTATPFQNIGLAFSGGGFRAASFCLGTLSYLHEVPWMDGGTLLRNVSYISSASGGTIANATYALSVARGKTFPEFYGYLFGQLEGLKLVSRVFAILNDGKIWKSEAYKNKRRNLINAFAIAYDQSLFNWPESPEGGATLQALMRGDQNGHLEEVCFNTTDFYRGLLFRQAVKLKPDMEPCKEFPYGNYVLNLVDGVQQKIRLADALAASSCFPAGFEPVVFPCDFATDRLSRDELLDSTQIQPQELKWSELCDLFVEDDIRAMLDGLPEPITVHDLQQGALDLEGEHRIRRDFETGFMDGGIDDNQGIDSMMRANERRVNGSTSFKPFDLMMTNDVGSHYMDPYRPVADAKNRGLMALSLRTVRWGSLLLGGTGAALIAAAVLLADSPWDVVLSIAGTALVLLFGGIFAGLSYLKRFIRDKTSTGGLDLQHIFSKEITRRFFDYFGGTPIGVLMDMLKARVSSVLTLSNDVFLKRIRQLLYERILDQGRGCFRIKTNHVYDLAYSNDVNRLANDAGTEELRKDLEKIQIVAQCAYEMGTTLWFSEPNKGGKNHNQAALIATGQFTTCYNLLLYIQRMHTKRKDGGSYYDDLKPEWQEKVELVRGKLSADFARFKEDPFWLYNERGGEWVVDFEGVGIGDYRFPEAEFGGLRDDNMYQK